MSKTYLASGAYAAGMPWAAWVLTASGILNAAYFLPILYRAWLRRPPGAWQGEQIAARGWRETRLLLLVPPLLSAAATVLSAVYSDHDWSPLAWARFIAERQYSR